MLGLFFILAIFIVAIISKTKSDVNDATIRKNRMNNWTFEKDPAAVFQTTHNGTVDLFTKEKVVVSRDKNNHLIKKYKSGEVEDVTAKVNEVTDNKRIREAFEKNHADKYIEYDVWNKQNTLKEGVYGDVYVDRNDASKKYVRRIFEVKITDIYDNNREYVPMGTVSIKHTGFCAYDYFRFNCLMNVENGKLNGLTDESEKWIEKYGKERKDEVLDIIAEFIKMFNEAQDQGGFMKKFVSAFGYGYTEKELYYCSYFGYMK